MWKPLEKVTKEELATLRRVRKAKLYADEDIEDEIVQVLRAEGINIKSARELGYRGQPDSFHASLAFKEKRFLLTKNGKHFLNDRELPFNRTFGLIVLDVDMRDTEDVIQAISRIFDLMPYGQIYEGMKIKVSAQEIMCRFIDQHGKRISQRFKLISREYYEWVDK